MALVDFTGAPLPLVEQKTVVGTRPGEEMSPAGLQTHSGQSTRARADRSSMSHKVTPQLAIW